MAAPPAASPAAPAPAAAGAAAARPLSPQQQRLPDCTPTAPSLRGGSVAGFSGQPSTLSFGENTMSTVPVSAQDAHVFAARFRGGTLLDPLSGDAVHSFTAEPAAPVDAPFAARHQDPQALLTLAPSRSGSGVPSTVTEAAQPALTLTPQEWDALRGSMRSSTHSSKQGGGAASEPTAGEDCYELLAQRLRDGGSPRERGALLTASRRLAVHGIPAERRAALWPLFAGAPGWRQRLGAAVWAQLSAAAGGGRPAERLCRCVATLAAQLHPPDREPPPGRPAGAPPTAVAEILVRAGVSEEDAFWTLCALAHDARFDLGSLWGSGGGLRRRAAELRAVLNSRAPRVDDYIATHGVHYADLVRPFAGALLLDQLDKDTAVRVFDVFVLRGWEALYAVLEEALRRAAHQLGLPQGGSQRPKERDLLFARGPGQQLGLRFAAGGSTEVVEVLPGSVAEGLDASWAVGMRVSHVNGVPISAWSELRDTLAGKDEFTLRFTEVVGAAKSSAACDKLLRATVDVLRSQGPSVLVSAWSAGLRPLTPPRPRPPPSTPLRKAHQATLPLLDFSHLSPPRGLSASDRDDSYGQPDSPGGGGAWLAAVAALSGHSGDSPRSGRDARQSSCRPTADAWLSDMCRLALQWEPPEGDCAPVVHLEHCPEAVITQYAAGQLRDLRHALGVSEEQWAHAWSRPLRIAEHSAGRSGSMFYPSHCGRFLIKSLSRDELQQAAELLPALLRHFARGSSLLCPPHALFSVEKAQSGGARGSIASPRFNGFAVFPSAFPARGSPGPTVAFDLKGSTHKRQASRADLARQPMLLKDLDLLEQVADGRRVIEFSVSDAQRLRDLIAADAAFLCAEGVMDYSLLVGICGPEPVDPLHAPCSVSVRLESGGRMCYMAIIDYLQAYTLKKRLAAAMKGLSADPSTLSTVPPQLYAARFERFMNTHLLRTQEGTPPPTAHSVRRGDSELSNNHRRIPSVQSTVSSAPLPTETTTPATSHTAGTAKGARWDS
eukprot:TRINITY_DN50401_c0_g1_i1.p1 TRINITY_DN50401_c0_g1~~TRINITY_DN50401_c0_g1_i1.p1  ORF type:complete len:1004 (+),score=251.64 TRINITY_DN50401_c0_g1_i1:159-3170(+)